MSRTSRIPYHQNVYDLLQLEPTECPEAARMIAEHEAKHRPVPEAVKEWYLLPNVAPPLEAVPVPGGYNPVRPDDAWNAIWISYAAPTTLEKVLAAVSRPRRPLGKPFVALVEVMSRNDGFQGVEDTCFQMNGWDDPPMWVLGSRLGPLHLTFSQFIWRECKSINRPIPVRDPFWLRSPFEPFEPAVIDFLVDQFDEPERTPRPGNVTTFTFRTEGGIIRITADEPALGGGLSAWWVHAGTSERLAELARLIVPFGTLRETLSADTEPARAVLTLLQK